MMIVLSLRAEQSLDEIINYYLTEHSPQRAQKVLDSIEQSFHKISRTPWRYTMNFDISKPQENIRQFIVHHTFKIIYRIGKDKIEVLEIFHGSRNPELLQDIE